jgi:hypothetical protein
MKWPGSRRSPGVDARHHTDTIDLPFNNAGRNQKNMINRRDAKHAENPLKHFKKLPKGKSYQVVIPGRAELRPGIQSLLIKQLLDSGLRRNDER